MKVHNINQQFPCLSCDKSFVSKGRLREHSRAHSGDRPFVCSVCNKSYISKTYLVQHFRVHSGERPYECSVCKKTYRKSSTLARHKRSHTDEVQYHCSICGKSFSLISYLMQHSIEHVSGDQAFACFVCYKDFPNWHSLLCHAKVHDFTKPFKFPPCDESFVTKFVLKKQPRSPRNLSVSTYNKISYVRKSTLQRRRNLN